MLVGRESVDKPICLQSPQVLVYVNTETSLDVLFLPCRTKLQFGSTVVACQKHDSDADAFPPFYQIQDLTKDKSHTVTPRGNKLNPAKTQ